jgi:hypothetical protein
MDELMQMAVIELVRKEAKTEGSNRVRHGIWIWTIQLTIRRGGFESSLSF